MPSTQSRVKYQRHNFPVNLDTVLISHAIRIVSESEYKTVYKHALGITLSVAYEIEAQLRRQIIPGHVLELLWTLRLVQSLSFEENFLSHIRRLRGLSWPWP
jgi:hypothetical protein